MSRGQHHQLLAVDPEQSTQLLEPVCLTHQEAKSLNYAVWRAEHKRRIFERRGRPPKVRQSKWSLLVDPMFCGLLLLGLPLLAWAGGPDPSQLPNVKQMWIQDAAQTVTEQAIPRGDLIKQLVLDIIEEVGWVKTLLWLAMLPLLGMAATVLGVVKYLQRRQSS